MAFFVYILFFTFSVNYCFKRIDSIKKGSEVKRKFMVEKRINTCALGANYNFFVMLFGPFLA